jgi:urease accessory protein
MLRATATSHSGDPADSITLDHEQRHRRRAAMVSDGGIEFLLDLPHAEYLQDGVRLQLDDGRCILVCAAAESVLDVQGPNLTRIAWHLGNRHTATQILADRLRIRDDHVLAEMLRGLGAEVTSVSAPFEPESGAYAHSQHGH